MKKPRQIEVLPPVDSPASAGTAVEQIERLVMNVAQQAVQDDTPLDQKVDALKACQPYYAALIKGKNREPGNQEAGFDDFASAIENAESRNGEARGSGRRSDA